MAISILLVDDDPVVRKTIEEIFASEPRLRDLEIELVQALDAPRGLAELAARKPDLVLTDLSVQGMDGFAFCSEVRRLAAGQPLGLVVMSGVYRDPRMIAPLLEELRATFAPKPLEAGSAGDAIARALPAPARVVPPMGLTSDTLMAIDPAALRAPQVPPGDESGSLADRPVARLLFDLLEARGTGSLVLVRGQMRKEIFLRGGQAVAADSNLRQEALGSLLVAKQVIDDAQLEYLLAETRARGQKMGTVLVELGWMTPEDVLQYLAAQARKRISDCLRWQEGTYTFLRGDTFGGRVMEHVLDTPKIVFTGLYRTAVADELIARIDDEGARPVRLLPRFEPFRPAFEAVFGPQILQPLHEGAPLGELVLRDDGRVLAQAIETLLTAGLAELAEEVRGSVHSRKTSEVFTLERLGLQAGGPLHPLGSSDDDGGTTQEEMHAFDPASAGVELELGGPDSGKVDLFARAPSNSDIAAPPRAAGGDDLRTALLREYLEVHGKSPYEILGLSPQAQPDDVTRAYQDKTARFSDQALVGRIQDADAAKLQSLRAAYERAFATLSDPVARAAHDQAQAQAGPPADPLGAELAFREGTALLERGQAAPAIASFEKAVAGRPDQAAYHAYLGWALFQARGLAGARAAKDRLSHALALDPDLAKAHEALGRVALEEGDSGTARRHLARALELEPAQPGVLDELVAVFDKLKDHRGAERCYRRMIASLGEGAPGLRARLWRALAEVYETKLNQVESARVAYETAARLAPSDVDLQRKVLELDGEDPGRWRESARALVAEWQQRPTDGSLGERLVSVFTNADKLDAAALAATACVLRGSPSEDWLELAQETRPAQLRPVSRPLDPELRQRLAFPGEDDEIEKLVGALAAGGIIERASDLDLGLNDATPVLPDQMPAPFRRVLRYVNETLGLKEPGKILAQPRLENEARIADARPPVLLVGTQLLETPDTVELAFRLGRALALGSAGRVAAVARTGRHLRPAFLAAVTLARGASASPEADVDDLMKRIINCSTVHKLKIMDTAGRLLRGRRSMDVSRWARSLVRTATRIGLLLSADLLRVGRAVDAEEGTAALDDLLAFALSPEHVELREELGTATSAVP
jgi:tetratricopeptide (TPR) repeat protein/CheY-like chemotaxis protein